MRSGGDGGDGKAPEQSQLPVVLVVDMLRLRTNQDRIDPENRPNFRPLAWGAGREKSGEWRVAGNSGQWSMAREQWSVVSECEERDVTPHASMTLGANHVSRAPESGRPLSLLVISGLATHGDGLRFHKRRCQHFCPRSGRFVCWNSAFSRHFTVHLFRPWIPSSRRCQHFLSSLGAFPAV